MLLNKNQTFVTSGRKGGKKASSKIRKDIGEKAYRKRMSEVSKARWSK